MRRVSAIVIGAIVAGAVAVGGVAVPLTNHPKFCASCHTIQPSYESWLQSSHKEVECIACHVRPGVAGWLHDKAWHGTRDVAITLFGKPTESHNLQAQVDSAVCLGCHRDILRLYRMWQRTKSANAAARLAALGVMPPKGDGRLQ